MELVKQNERVDFEYLSFQVMIDLFVHLLAFADYFTTEVVFYFAEELKQVRIIL